MANIDLRPWREERRKARQNQFVTILAIVALIACAIGWSWNQSVRNQVKYQTTRNTYLQGKLKELDGKIEEIRTIREQREQLIDRMNVIQSLDRDRPIIVHVFDELVQATPDGVFFTRLQTVGTTVSILGQADKLLSLTDFLRNLNASPWFADEILVNVVAKKEEGEIVGHSFEVRMNRINPAVEDDQEGQS